MKNLIVYRQTLLPLSETFIKAQSGAIRGFWVRFAGLQPAQPSLELPSAPILQHHKRSFLSRTRARLYEYSGISPAFHRNVGMANAQLLHAHFAPDGASALPLCSRLKLPLIVTLHGYDVTTDDQGLARTLAGKLYLRARNKLFDQASLFICASEFIHRKALERGYPGEKLRTHYIGVDRTIFTPTQRPRNNQILFVGRLVCNKGCSYLLRGMELVQRVVPTARLVIVGAGPLRQSLQDEADRLQLNCSFVGTQSTSAVKRLLSESTLLCLPSVTAKGGAAEGLGMVLLEAQASGRPVVGFRTGGIPEAVRDGLTGLLSPPADIASLAQNIITFLQDENFWNAASREAVEWVGTRFDLHTQTAELERIYQKVAAGPSPT